MTELDFAVWSIRTSAMKVPCPYSICPKPNVYVKKMYYKLSPKQSLTRISQPDVISFGNM